MVRDGDVVRLVPDPRWDVDLLDFQRWCIGAPEQRVRAFRMVDGLLGQAQFPYDPHLGEERAVLTSRWLQLAEGLVGEGLVTVDEALRRSRHLSIDLHL